MSTLVFQNQHEENHNRNGDQIGIVLRQGMPAGLLRRYEVNITPSFAEQARKIREIKAVGMRLEYYFSIICN